MPLSSLFLFLSILSFFIYPTVSSPTSTVSISTSVSSTVASSQLKFWSQNVYNDIPKAILSKLSPLIESECKYFASLISNQSIASDANFCSRADLACTTKIKNEIVLGLGYEYRQSNISMHNKLIDKNTFFRLSHLTEGNIAHLPNFYDSYPHRAFLPYEIASKISIDLVELQNLFPQSFVFQKTKDVIQTTLDYCTAPALGGGSLKSCLTSLEGIIGFSKKALGKKYLFAVTAKSTSGSGKELIIANIRMFNEPSIVSCHEVFLPFSTYFCHMLTATRLYVVDVVEPETRKTVNTVPVVCHMDTSSWPVNHVAFKLLKGSPGLIEACHWMTQVDLVFIGKNIAMK